MSVLVFAESFKGQCKKSAFVAVSYGRKVAEQMGVDCHAVTIGQIQNIAELAQYGAAKIHQINKDADGFVESQSYSKAICDLAQEINASLVLMSHSSQGKSIAGRVAVRLNAGLVTAVNALPNTDGGFKVQKSLFSGKAISNYDVNSSTKVLTLIGNAVKPETVDTTSELVDSSVALSESRVKLVSTETVEGTVPLSEAEIVVSAGRGMKGPENWGIIDELANTINGTTACSRPVADADWRPHHEHVGQTGVAIRPNLYIAIGISGAIQHLAGVNNSKVIVVINKDPEAPFFKAADYGVVGDLFDVVPKLNEAFKKVMAE